MVPFLLQPKDPCVPGAPTVIPAGIGGAAIEKTGAAGGKDMGKVIASLKADYPGRIDFGKASGKVKAALG